MEKCDGLWCNRYVQGLGLGNIEVLTIRTGNGVIDDTAAINRAIAEGGRCGINCGSSTIFPATVFFPAGNYLVSSPIIQYYNTEMLGDVSSRFHSTDSKCFAYLS